jgi:hypothetical protein
MVYFASESQIAVIYSRESTVKYYRSAVEKEALFKYAAC